MFNFNRLSFAVATTVAIAVATPALTQVQSASQIQATAILASRQLEPLGRDPVIVAAVRKYNEKKLPLAVVQRADREWSAAKHTTSSMKEIASHPVAKHIVSLAPPSRGITETLLLAGNGELVAFSGPVPADYYHGDQPKWQRTTKQMKPFVDRMVRDETSGAVIVQISVPVIDGNSAIGAVTFSVDVARYR